MVVTQLSNSFVGPATGHVESDAEKRLAGNDNDRNSLTQQMDHKAVWGLYCVYAIIGVVNGFFATYFNSPIVCQYVFGPMGDGPNDHTSAAQCNVAATVYQISWNFKLFFGIVLDIVPFFGSRRKGWMIFGWTGGLAMLALVAFVTDHLVATHQFETYLYLMMVACVFSTFSDVAGDGMIIEMSKLESPDKKGHILTTCQMVRFLMMAISTGLGTLFMSGESYQPPKHDAGALELPFELSYSGMHWLLFGVSLPFYIGMLLFLRDPPAPENHESGCAGFRTAGARIWSALKSFAIFNLLIYSVGIMGIASMLNPATNQVASIASPSTIQVGMGVLLGNVLFVGGVWLFRKFFLHTNWRITLFLTQALIALCSGLSVMIVYDTWGISRNGWFYMFQANVPNFIQGVGQVVGSLAVVEVSPPGLEATIYELLTSATNGAIALEASLQTTFGHMFNLDEINITTFFGPLQKEYANRLAHATLFALAVNVSAAVIFVWFLPKNPEQCRDWSSRKSWHSNFVGFLNLVVFAGPFIYANASTLAMVADPARA